MGNNRLRFWVHPYIGGTGIQGLLESHLNIEFTQYDKTKVNPTQKNIIIFFWETTASINLEHKTNNSEFFDLIKELNELGFHFLADYTTEANYHIDSERITFIDKLLECGVGLDRFYLASNNCDDYEIQYGPHLIKHLYFPHFLLATPLKMNEYVGDLSQYESIKPTKDFLCLNRRVQEHKFNFVNRLSERGILPYTNLSLVANKTNPDLMRNSSLVKELNIDVDNFQSIQLENDVMYGQELDTADQHLYTINPKWYFDSKVNIVIETNVGDSPTHFTEKIFKPIYLGKPFVVYSTKNYLNKLREFGFTAFVDIIGEYDCTNIDSVIDAAIKLSFIYNKEHVRASCDWNKRNLRNNNIVNNFIDSLR